MKLLFLSLVPYTAAFVARPRPIHAGLSHPTSLSMSDADGINEMRRLLEGSWNSDMMGKLPTTPLDAANEAGGSLLTAKERGLELVMINLLLPSYDITMGSSVYDEVEAVTFCVALSKFLEGKTSIVVRDNKTVHTVNRILAAREKDEAAAAAEIENLVKSDVEDVEEEEEDVDDEEGEEDVEAIEGAEEKDEADDKEDTKNSDDLEDFRRQLMMDWDDGEDTMPVADGATTIPKEELVIEDEETGPQAASSESSLASKPESYRLTSMFGDATFTPGPDMFDKVVKAVSANGQPKEDEDTMIILSANSEEETIAIRALVAKYQQSKTIVLVNCQMDPVPRELIKAETIYSLLPLIAKPVGDKANAPSTSQPKVIVLRRYPRDFEVFMDFGAGFDLIETVTTDQVGRRGPSMAWIVDRLQRQLNSRL